MRAVAQPALRTVQAVLFDLDGTLLDSAADLGAAANAVRQSHGLAAMPLASYRHMAGSCARGMVAVAFGLAPGDPQYLALRDECLNHYERCMTERTVAFDGVAELVAALCGNRLRWGVVTNKASRFTDPLTRGIALFASASTIVSGDTTAHTKPHPAPLLEAARRLSIAPGECVYVGDDERDIVAGRAAGMQTVAANYGYLGANANTALWGADATIDAPLQLLGLLASSRGVAQRGERGSVPGPAFARH